MQKLEADTASSETKQPEFLRWDENQCKAGLARLEQLQDEVCYHDNISSLNKLINSNI